VLSYKGNLYFNRLNNNPLKMGKKIILKRSYA